MLLGYQLSYEATQLLYKRVSLLGSCVPVKGPFVHEVQGKQEIVKWSLHLSGQFQGLPSMFESWGGGGGGG